MQLTIKDINKSYRGGIRALNNINLSIDEGIFGLLGPNGAGKSSLLKIIATIQSPDNGELWLGDLNILSNTHEFKKKLGYLPQEFGVYSGISAEKLLEYYAILKGIINKSERKELVNFLLNRVNLYKDRKRNVITFSGGMRQRFGIAQALLGQPKVIIVDEPTAGLDPFERISFYNLLSEISENAIVILSTHIVEDVNSVCNTIAIINNGKVVINGSPVELLKSFDGTVWRKRITKSDLPDYRERYRVLYYYFYNGELFIHVHSENYPGEHFELIPPDLEDIYFFETEFKF